MALVRQCSKLDACPAQAQIAALHKSAHCTPLCWQFFARGAFAWPAVQRVQGFRPGLLGLLQGYVDGTACLAASFLDWPVRRLSSGQPANVMFSADGGLMVVLCWPGLKHGISINAIHLSALSWCLWLHCSAQPASACKADSCRSVLHGMMHRRGGCAASLIRQPDTLYLSQQAERAVQHCPVVATGSAAVHACCSDLRSHIGSAAMLLHLSGPFHQP